MVSKLKPISVFISVSGVLENQLTLPVAKSSYSVGSFSHRWRSLAGDHSRDLAHQLRRYCHVVSMLLRKLHLSNKNS
jgi:hypothetical protein